MLLMGKFTISMAMFNSFLYVYDEMIHDEIGCFTLSNPPTAVEWGTPSSFSCNGRFVARQFKWLISPKYGSKYKSYIGIYIYV